MSGLEHPELLFDIDAEFDQKRQFASELFQLVERHGEKTVYQFNNTTSLIDVTQPTPLRTTGDSCLLFRALRLPTVVTTAETTDDIDSSPLGPSEEYVPVELQYASVPEFDGILESDELDWQDYVVAIANVQDSEKLYVMDKSNGQELSASDLFQAGLTLGALRKSYLRAQSEDWVNAVATENFESMDTARESDHQAAPQITRTFTDSFDASRFTVRPTCQHCDHGGTGCGHDLGLFN